MHVKPGTAILLHKEYFSPSTFLFIYAQETIGTHVDCILLSGRAFNSVVPVTIRQHNWHKKCAQKVAATGRAANGLCSIPCHRCIYVNRFIALGIFDSTVTPQIVSFDHIVKVGT